METLRVGSPLDKAVDIGAIVAPVQLERIRGLVQQGIDEGAACWQPSWSVPAEGLFYPPTLFTDVAPSSTVAQVEIFGPVVVAMTFRTPDEQSSSRTTTFGRALVMERELNLALDSPPHQAGNGRSLQELSCCVGFGGIGEGFGVRRQED